MQVELVKLQEWIKNQGLKVVVVFEGRDAAGKGGSIKRIADKHAIPAQFLVQILSRLKRAGLVRSIRGSSGGYRLARDPERITLADVLEALDQLPAELVTPASRPTAARRVLQRAWNRVLRAHREQLRAITLAQLDRQARDQTADMYYI